MPDVYLPYQNNLNKQYRDRLSKVTEIPALHKFNTDTDLVADQNVMGPNGKSLHTNRVVNFNHTADLAILQRFNKFLLRRDTLQYEKDEWLETRNPIALPYWKAGFFTYA